MCVFFAVFCECFFEKRVEGKLIDRQDLLAKLTSRPTLIRSDYLIDISKRATFIDK